MSELAQRGQAAVPAGHAKQAVQQSPATAGEGLTQRNPQAPLRHQLIPLLLCQQRQLLILHNTGGCAPRLRGGFLVYGCCAGLLLHCGLLRQLLLLLCLLLRLLLLLSNFRRCFRAAAISCRTAVRLCLYHSDVSQAPPPLLCHLAEPALGRKCHGL